jgi:pimeloyl-ACP methyl ester carboxylesterase
MFSVTINNMPKIPTIPPEYIHPLQINNLEGRVLEVPSSQTGTPILFIYGHHASLERIYSTTQALAEIAPVTAPDMPGFGGMMSLGSVGQPPTLDNLADYMAAFIHKRFTDNQKFSIIGMSLGFVVAVRMLQRHPEIAPQVAHIISMAGFVHRDDFSASPRRRKLFASLAKLMARKPTSYFFSHFILQRPLIAGTYQLRARSHPKMKGYTYEERKDLINFEIVLWKTNEVRTYFALLAEMLDLDLTATKIPVAVEHIAVAGDQYFNNAEVVAHMKKIFTAVRQHDAHLATHAPTVIEEIDDARQFIPQSLVKVLAERS